MVNAADISPEATREELKRLYDWASDYDLPPGDQNKARVRVKAGRMLISSKPVRRAAHAGEEVEIEVRIVQEEIDKAIDWLSLQAAAVQPPRQYVVDPSWRGC